MKLLKIVALSVLAGCLLMPNMAAARSSEPSVDSNPVLANIQKIGAKLYYLGNRYGLEGWFIVKDGKVQIAYSTPDHKGIIIGALFGEDGENITGAQVKTLVEGNKELTQILANPQGTASSTPVAPQAVAPTPTPAPSVAPAVATTAPTASPAATSPGERLYSDLSGATGVTLGAGSSKLLMVMDPNCPHCQATWRVLRDAVVNNKIQLRMIPIATPDSDNERAASQLLHTVDPLNAWDKYVGKDKGAGDKAQLAGAADAGFVTAIRANHTLVDSWHIDQTPYLVYRGKDGKVKIVVGEPEKVSTILSDIAP